jgi:hypothetical protein
VAFTPLRSPLIPPTEPLWPLSVAQYHQMLATGILSSDDPVELLAGWLVQKMPKNPPHRIATRLTREALEFIIPQGLMEQVGYCSVTRLDHQFFQPVLVGTK